MSVSGNNPNSIGAPYNFIPPSITSSGTPALLENLDFTGSFTPTPGGARMLTINMLMQTYTAASSGTICRGIEITVDVP
jgi:hypothetical protein